ncbi:MAG: ABC transporter ATP-binding protein [Gammaproteobacteria bacterium]|nr:ABC transporter ATP-binding protein [Gammaproteobacteria bacterium]
MTEMTLDPWLTLWKLSFSRGDRIILRDISLSIRPGDLTLLTGHNGAGKTTLLRILSGLLPPDYAELEYHGSKHPYDRQSRSFLRRNTCYLHQQPYLFDATVFDNIAYGLRRRGLCKQDITERIKTALQATDLEYLAQRHSHQLSGGEQQRVAMVRAWILSPQLMLLDEPVANMDKPSRRKGLSLINHMRRDGIAVILSSHDPQHGELEITRHLHLYQGSMAIKEQQELAPNPGIVTVNHRFPSP